MLGSAGHAGDDGVGVIVVVWDGEGELLAVAVTVLLGVGDAVAAAVRLGVGDAVAAAVRLGDGVGGAVAEEDTEALVDGCADGSE